MSRPGLSSVLVIGSIAGTGSRTSLLNESLPINKILLVSVYNCMSHNSNGVDDDVLESMNLSLVTFSMGRDEEVWSHGNEHGKSVLSEPYCTLIVDC